MKKILLLILSLLMFGSVFSQTYNNVFGKQNFKDSARFSKYKNNTGLDSILITDANGNLKLIKNNTTYITTYIDSSLTIINNYIGNDSSNKVFPDGAVIWDSLLIFHSLPYTYSINSKIFTAPATDFTLDPAYVTANRIDIWVVDTFGIISVLKGDSSGLAPQADPSYQIQVAFASIYAGATTPAGFSNNIVYKEHLEFTVTGTIIGMDPDYLVNPYAGVKSLSIPTISNIPNQYIEFTSPTTLYAYDYTTLPFYLRLGSTFNNSTRLSISFWNGTTKVSNDLIIASGTYGFNRFISGSYQLVAPPLSAFNFTNAGFNRIRITTSGTNTNGFQLDNIILQSGTTNTTTTTGVITFNGQQGHVIYIRSTTLNYDSTKYLNYVNGVLSDSVVIIKTPIRAGTNVTFTNSGDTVIINSTGGTDSTAWHSGTVINDSTLKVYNLKGDSTIFIIPGGKRVVNIYSSADSVYQVAVYSDGTVDSTKWVGDGISAGGTVTSFSAGDLSPLFTSSVANATTTPSHTFTLNNTTPLTIFSRLSGTGVPSWNAADSNLITDLHSQNYYDLRYSSINNSIIDSTINWSVLDSLSTPPALSYTGNIYLVGTSPTGNFVAHQNEIATSTDSVNYTFQSASVGNLLLNASTSYVSKWNGSTWIRIGKTYILQGGNNFGAKVEIGTKDNFGLDFKTNDITKMKITSKGNVIFKSNFTVPGISSDTAVVITPSMTAVGDNAVLNALVIAPTFSKGIYNNVLRRGLYIKSLGTDYDEELIKIDGGAGTAFSVRASGHTVFSNLVSSVLSTPYHTVEIASIQGGGYGFRSRIGGSLTSTITQTNVATDVDIFNTSGTINYVDYEAKPRVNNVGTGINNIKGFYFNPQISSYTNLNAIGFHNVIGDNIFGTTSGSVGIGASTTISPSAILDVKSTTKGVLLPRMTKVQRDAIAAPATGLTIWQTDNTPGLRSYNGTNWMKFTESID